MKTIKKHPKTIFAILILLILLFPITYYHEKIWGVIDKIGALATGLALFAAMYQGYVAWKAANLTRQANFQNLFQQKFNLILEQHNNSLKNIIEWSKSKNPEFNKMDTESLVKTIRGHEELSPYMRILYHTLKSIREELPTVEGANESELILRQKRYTSLVRSFIPNEILMYIACNASVLDENFFALEGSKQYEYFNNMLNDYDFFEHLRFEKHKTIYLEDTIKEITHTIYEDCFYFYESNLTFEKYKSYENRQISSVKKLLDNPDFFICLSYNLKNKAINIECDIERKTSVKDVIFEIFNKNINQINESGFLKYLSLKTNEEIERIIKKIVSDENKTFSSPSNYSTGYFYNEKKIFDFFLSAMKYGKEKNSLLTFRDNFQSDLQLLILSSSSESASQFRSPDAYKYNAEKVYSSLVENITRRMNGLIKFRQRIEYDVSSGELIEYKKNALQNYIDKFKST